MLPLIGIAIVVLGFAFRVNPLLVVAGAAIGTGLGAGHSLLDVIGEFGRAFINSRSVAVVWLALPVIGMLEKAGLKERARELIAGIRVATAGRLLLAYLALRQIASALGLTSLGGHPQVVRPLLAPMAEAAADKEHGPVPDKTRWFIRAHAAAVDNIGLFFGEDVFIAIGSILLIKSFLEQNGIAVEPVNLAKWAIPTAIAAFVIHGARLLMLDRRIRAMAAEPGEEAPK
ncbi:MAG TPA: DUF969 domain-containing protein [Gemmatimonadaceae bacterium]|nr:DUF969 domain-containing protein [Gemmatimonadaceae bacterium]